MLKETNTPTRPRIEPGSPDPESDALTIRPVRPLVPVWKWKPFLELYFKKISSLTRYHHFRMTSSEPGVVYVREFPSSTETRLTIVKDQAKIPELLSSEPELISPPGLSPERAWYLYENVRQHCECDNNKDTTCPKPSVPKPRSMKAHPCKTDKE